MRPGPRAPLEVRELSEVCGTDVHLHEGRLDAVPYPIIPGHVAVGRVAKIRGRIFDVEGAPWSWGSTRTAEKPRSTRTPT